MTEYAFALNFNVVDSYGQTIGTCDWTGTVDVPVNQTRHEFYERILSLVKIRAARFGMVAGTLNFLTFGPDEMCSTVGVSRDKVQKAINTLVNDPEMWRHSVDELTNIFLDAYGD